MLSRQKRDYYGGGLMMLLGIIAVAEGQRYGIGSPTRMGPGFFPVALGLVMLFLGALIVGTAFLAREPDQESLLPKDPQWFAWGCIILSPIAFIILGEYAGLLPATLACVFIAAIGDKQTTIRQAALLSCFVAVLGILLFSYLLKIPFPIIRGVWL